MKADGNFKVYTMIWDKLSPFYDFFENVYNGKCYKGIAEKIKVAKYSNTKVRKVNILELPYKDDKFDVVVAANVIHLLDESDKAISEL